MKKTLLTIGFVSLLLANVYALDSTGCGLGSIVWRGERGLLHKFWL